jgi:cytosine/adenosine deaminase-related metal-dependent hydrolase
MLIRNADAILTGLAGPEMRSPGRDIRVAGSRIAEIGRLSPLPGEPELDARGCIIYPGWVNTHHHLLQSLMKGIPAGLNEGLNGWLAAVPYAYRARLDDESLETAAMLGLSELLLSGCSTVADFHNLYYRGIGFDGAAILFDVAERLGIRLVLCRGSATVARNVKPQPGALPAESLAEIVKDVEGLVSRFHDPSPDAHRRVVMAPTTMTWSTQAEELPVLAQEGRRLGLRLHSHLSETNDYVTYCRDMFGIRPVEFARRYEWLGEDVWFAHMVHVDDDEIRMLAESGTGVSHCPGSNCRLGSGIAPISRMASAGILVGLGQDGGASNEPGDMISDAHLAWYLQRAIGGPGAATVEDVIGWGTRDGAKLLGLDAVGVLAPGYAADIAIYDLDDARFWSLHDRAIAPVATGVRPRLRYMLVGGRVVVENDRVLGIDAGVIRARVEKALRSFGVSAFAP